MSTIANQIEEALGRSVQEKEFRQALTSLAERGLLKAFQWNEPAQDYVDTHDLENASISDLWFQPTESGRGFVEENYDAMFPGE